MIITEAYKICSQNICIQLSGQSNVLQVTDVHTGTHLMSTHLFEFQATFIWNSTLLWYPKLWMFVRTRPVWVVSDFFVLTA